MRRGGERGGRAPTGGEEPGASCGVLSARAPVLLPGGQLLGALGDRRVRGLPASWEHGEDATGARKERHTRVSVVQALALAQLGMGVPDGSIEPLQQEIEANRIYTATVVSVRWCAKHEGSSCGCNVTSYFSKKFVIPFIPVSYSNQWC